MRQFLRRTYFYLVTVPNLFRLHEMSFLRKHLKIRNEDRILDVACGIGVYADFLSTKAQYVFAFDLSLDNIVIADRIRMDNAFFYCGNAEEISHPDSSFDIVVSICAIEHFMDSSKALKEMKRILKPGGQLLITVDSLENINSREFIEFHRKFCHVQKYFTIETIRRELEDVGFEIKVLKPLLTSFLSSVICRWAFKIMKWPFLFILYSLLAYPLSVISDGFSLRRNSGLTIAAYAVKPKITA